MIKLKHDITKIEIFKRSKMLLKLDVSAFHLLSNHVHSREISEIDNEWIGLFLYEKTHGISTSIGPG